MARWTPVEGLPQNAVTDILQLPNGEPWMGTFGGPARFDGLGVRVIDMAADEGRSANRIVALAPAAAWDSTEGRGMVSEPSAGVVPAIPPGFAAGARVPEEPGPVLLEREVAEFRDRAAARDHAAREVGRPDQAVGRAGGPAG